MTPTLLMLMASEQCIYVYLDTLPPSKYATPEERDYRFKVFKGHLKSSDNHNAMLQSGPDPAVFGINGLSDRADKEIGRGLKYTPPKHSAIFKSLEQFLLKLKPFYESFQSKQTTPPRKAKIDGNLTVCDNCTIYLYPF